MDTGGTSSYTPKTRGTLPFPAGLGTSTYTSCTTCRFIVPYDRKEGFERWVDWILEEYADLWKALS